MLVELDIANLAVIDHARIPFGPGLNVLTGETGAGKSIVIDALNLLIGVRADAGMIRAGTDAARVEGIFEAHGLSPETMASLVEAGLVGEDASDEPLILAREVSASGRSVGRVNRRAVPARLLAELGEQLIDIHGQGAHLSLLRVPEHVGMLDRWGGLGDLRRQVAAEHSHLRRLQRELAGLRGNERELARRADLLRHQVDEISAARLVAGEEEELRAEQRVQAHAEQILQLAGAAYGAVAGGEVDASSARDLLGSAQQMLSQLEGFDPSITPLAEQAASIGLQLDDLGLALRAYRDRVEYRPERLAEVEERLGVLFSLKRKYGSSVEEALAFAEGARSELAALEGREGVIAGLEAEERSLLAALAGLVGSLNAGRREAAQGLERQVEQQLTTLSMQGSFQVQFTAAGPDEPEAAEFLLSLNPGEPVRQLVKVASGGETSRVMLAIKAALAGADHRSTLVFDEIDTGIGGRVGEVVGGKLWDLARHSQVLAVTHLPQLAAFGDVHLRVDKEVEGGRTVTRVTRLAQEGRVDELAEMFGSDREAGRRQAATLLDRAAQLAAASGADR
ncbi:MAG: DNA repair protein RecN [Actinomycetota bacterium]